MALLDPLLPMVALGILASAPAEHADARVLVSDFVVADLKGRPDRAEFAQLSPERRRAAEAAAGPEELPENGLVLESVWDPFVAVTSHRVLDVRTSGRSGTATVEYAKVAESNRLDLRETAGVERVTLRLRFDGRRWWIVDPPPAHVELAALIRLFEGEMKLYGAEWEAHASPEQNSARDRTAAALQVLRALKARAPAPPAATGG